MEDTSPLTPEFLQSFLATHYSSLVGNLRIKYREGKPMWIDVVKTPLEELYELDEDDEIKRRIQKKKTVRYRD